MNLNTLDERDFNRVLADSEISSNANRFVLQVSQDVEGYVDRNPTIEALLSFPSALGMQSRPPSSPRIPVIPTRTSIINSIQYDTQKRRWTGIPSTPRKAIDLFEPLMNIINTLLHFSSVDMIAYLATSDTSRVMDDGSTQLMKTDLQLVHYGFMAYILEKKKAEAQSGFGLGAKAKKHQNADEILLDQWQQMVDFSANFVSEVCLDRDVKQCREWLMVYAKERLMDLRNELWCLCILFTETTLEVYSLDRMGIYSSTTVKYHKDPVLFAQAILGFASDAMGKVVSTFDNAIQFEQAANIIATTYSIPESFTLQASEKSKIKSHNVAATITAIPEDLEKIRGEASKYESTHPILPDLYVYIRPKYRGHPKKLWKNDTSPIKHPAEHPLPRISTKMTLIPVTKPVTHFRSKKEFLSAFVDILRAHEGLSDNGVLHDDITPKKMSISTDDGAVFMCEIER